LQRFEYSFGIRPGAQSGDIELEFHDVRVVVDPFSAPYLKGATMTLETLAESGFKIDNPNASSRAVRPTASRSRRHGPEDVGGCGSGCSH